MAILNEQIEELEADGDKSRKKIKALSAELASAESEAHTLETDLKKANTDLQMADDE